MSISITVYTFLLGQLSHLLPVKIGFTWVETS